MENLYWKEVGTDKYVLVEKIIERFHPTVEVEYEITDEAGRRIIFTAQEINIFP